MQKHLHVIGICGVATSALAIAFHKKGWKVTGSDKGFFPPISTELEKQGVEFYAGWHVEKMGTPDIVIAGTASGSQNPETQYAKEKNIPIYSFAQAIGEFFAKQNCIVCVGTWGKSSSSAILSFIMNDLDPTYMFGGLSLSHDASAKLTDSDWSVFEGDEYKSAPTDPTAKFFYYKPTHLLLSAISWDHADLYPTEQSYFDVFNKLISSVSGPIVAHTSTRAHVPKAIWYGETDADYMYKNITQTKSGIDFVITHKGTDYPIHSPMLGKFQAENITGCFAMAHSIGITPEKIIQRIAEFNGMKRRLEKRFEGRSTIFDDIAHSPEKAAFTLKNLREIYPDKKIVVIFEPNIGGRELASAYKYDNAFKDADEVIIPRLTKLKMGEIMPMEGKDLSVVIAKTHPNVKYIEDDAELVKTLKGDIIAFLGSHGFRGMIEATISLHQQSQ
jgi:UDP-N-acetylmuramate: L-alanyl-gamma-D-glutamyl-meso-diaminopimelate ligase